MFSKSSKSPNGATPAYTAPAAISETPKPLPNRNAAPSIISADLKIVGDLTSAGDIQIDGHVEGDINSRTITIGEAAQVTGSISGDTIRVCGSINGQIKGQTVTLDKSARVVGDILHHSLAIEPGAFIEGHCRRIDSKSAGIAGVGATAAAPAASGEIKPAVVANSPKQYAAS
jgi:cytoskeletal protein CcmA (bactofilin family)